MELNRCFECRPRSVPREFLKFVSEYLEPTHSDTLLKVELFKGCGNAADSRVCSAELQEWGGIVWNGRIGLRLSALQVEQGCAGSLNGTFIVCALADNSNSGNDRLLDT